MLRLFALALFFTACQRPADMRPYRPGNYHSYPAGYHSRKQYLRSSRIRAMEAEKRQQAERTGY